MSNILFNDNNKKIFDNVVKKNINTLVNNYISDTLYILQFQLNKLSNNNLNFNFTTCKSTKCLDESINTNEELDVIKRINDSLEKELLCLNTPKEDDMSKIIRALSQRNKLLNKLIKMYYTKVQLLESKEINSKNKPKNIIQRNNNNTLTKKVYKVNEGYAGIDTYLENSKKNNYYNYKTDINYLNSNYDISNEDSFYIKNLNENETKFSKINDNNNIFNTFNNNNIKNLAIVYNDNINIDGGNNKTIEIVNHQRKNLNEKMKKNKKKRHSNSVVHALNNDILDVKIDNQKSKFNMKKIFQLNRLNLEKLNDISTNILSTKNKNEEK